MLKGIKNLKSIKNLNKSYFHSSCLNFSEKKSTKLWGGRFSKDVDTRLSDWTESVTIDRHIIMEDTWGSIAHVTMLGVQGIIPAEHSAKIIGGLRNLQDEYKAGTWDIGRQQEDVHMNVEATLIQRLGVNVAGRMHTTRSRNDQVPLDSKLYTRKRLLELRERTCDAVDSFLTRSSKHLEDVMVSYTHVQHAQPVSVAYWLSHYAAVLIRDLERLKRSYDVTDQNPLGSGAIAGTSFPIDRNLTTRLMGFQKVHPHGLDATGNRDFMLEVLSNVAILQNTLSRLAEEFIFWSSYEFRSLTLDDGFAMGSSMMPQKKNPGALELMRGRTGRINGLANAGFTMMKGLPSGYNRDFHEDKEILVSALDLINKAVEVVPALIETTTINLKRMEELTFKQYSTATEVANYLVAKHDVPFREAHHIVGSLVGELYRSGQDFSNTDFCIKHIIQTHNIKANPDDIKKVLDSKSVMLSYNSLGGTGPKSVQAMLDDFNNQLKEHRRVLKEDQTRVDNAFLACREIARKAEGVTSVQQLRDLIPRDRKSVV